MFNSLLLQFRQTVNDAQPDFVTHLHLHHLGGQTAPHAQRVFHLELHLPSAEFDKMKEQQGGQALQFVVAGVFAEIQNLGHDRRPRSRRFLSLFYRPNTD
ncbi:protein of unknown function [Nitrospira japonica]|uniref:Uncharacterized protein n=1 Tax=Nitrospira japonica TaxID=1325564 RepID=A0A1W1I3H0_9BACT|nr:protein of unknown function [Nitrospira japonica]